MVQGTSIRTVLQLHAASLERAVFGLYKSSFKRYYPLKQRVAAAAALKMQLASCNTLGKPEPA